METSVRLSDDDHPLVQAKAEDHGTWDDYSDYMSSDDYQGMNRIQLAAYPWVARMSNRTIGKIRSEGDL